MAGYTPNLGLYFKDPLTDGQDTFNVTTMLNENWEKLDQNAKALLIRAHIVKIASYETAGAYEWEAPDLCDGKPYKIGVLIIGGGGSGGCGFCGSDSVDRYTSGGASGFSRHLIMIVVPGDKKALVVGKGGARVTANSSFVYGENGGTSSFEGIVAIGGEGGMAGNNYGISLGARGSYGSNHGVYGLDVAKDTSGNPSYSKQQDEVSVSSPWQCLNWFEGREILGSGGGVYGPEDEEYTDPRPGGKNPVTGKGGGNGGGVSNKNETATGEDASEPGCGGGGAAGNAARISGAGADGAVYIYFLGVAEE